MSTNINELADTQIVIEMQLRVQAANSNSRCKNLGKSGSCGFHVGAVQNMVWITGSKATRCSDHKNQEW